MNKITPKSGVGYFLHGFELITKTGLKRFVFIPLTINLLLFSIAFYFIFLQLESWFITINEWIPSWLDWLNYLLWPMAILAVLVGFSFLFNTLANWIAAPFNGLLAEKTEQYLCGEVSQDGKLTDVIKDIPRTVGREWQKLAYYLPRAVGFLILFFLLPVIGQILWFLFSAWMMTIQYCDYPYDNHKVPFHEMRSQLLERKSLNFSFGITVMVFAMIPIVNFLVMPVAICGATAMWVDKKHMTQQANQH